jgi:hypothetical protein
MSGRALRRSERFLAASVTVLAFALGFWLPLKLLRPSRPADPPPTLQLSPQHQKEEGILPKDTHLLLASIGLAHKKKA